MQITGNYLSHSWWYQMTSQRKVTRKTRQTQGQDRVVNEKFQAKRNLPPVVARTEFQRELLKALRTQQVVIAEGPAGTGKTFCCTSHAGDQLINGKISKLILSRPSVGMGKTVGLLKGDLKDKFQPYLAPLIEEFVERHGRGTYETQLSAGNIEMVPYEYMRGRNIKGIAIIDEAQNSTPDEMYTILTRLGDEGQLILMGDTTQNDIKGENGLQWLKRFVRENDLEDITTMVSATSEDIVRGDFCKRVVQARENEIAFKRAA